MNTAASDPTSIPPRTSVKVIKQRVVASSASSPEEDDLAIEDPLEIVLHYDGAFETRVTKQLTLTMRTPGHDGEMITGFLYSEGIIRAAADIESIRFNEPAGHEPATQAHVELRVGLKFSPESLDRNFAVHSSCGVCGKTAIENLALPAGLKIDNSVLVDAEWIHELPGRMRKEQEVFRKTGGLHAAAIFTSGGELLASREDIGRHNALDKVIGANLLAGYHPGHGRILCVSGRMSYEILQKALIARIPVIAGVGAPSSLAVVMANDFNVTLIGFVRNNSFNIYSCPERIRTR